MTLRILHKFSKIVTKFWIRTKMDKLHRCPADIFSCVIIQTGSTCTNLIGGSRGTCLAHAPQGSRFFRFDIQNFRNVTAFGVGAPLMRSTAPLMRNVHLSHCQSHFKSFNPICWYSKGPFTLSLH